jgi:hypothetical protein
MRMRRTLMRTWAPTLPDAGDDPRHFLQCAGAGVTVPASELGGHQLMDAKHVERQRAVAVVVAAEEARSARASHAFQRQRLRHGYFLTPPHPG